MRDGVCVDVGVLLGVDVEDGVFDGVRDEDRVDELEGEGVVALLQGHSR